jgi:hypothetical protein
MLTELTSQPEIIHKAENFERSFNSDVIYRKWRRFIRMQTIIEKYMFLRMHMKIIQ